MTGADEIRGKSTAITTELDKILTMYDKLTWKGESHDKIRNNIEAFVSDAKSVISSKMEILAQFANAYQAFQEDSSNTQVTRDERCQHCPTHNPSSPTTDKCHYIHPIDSNHDGITDLWLNLGDCKPYTTKKTEISEHVKSMSRILKVDAPSIMKQFPAESVQEGSGTDPTAIDYAIVEVDGGEGAELFELDTSIAATADAALTAIKAKLTTYKGDVSGFDMTNSDETADVDLHRGCEQQAGLWKLEMTKEKETVVKDLQTTIGRVENIRKAINCVVDEHKKLQDALSKKCTELMADYGFKVQAGTETSPTDSTLDPTGVTPYTGGGGYYGGGAGAAAGQNCPNPEDGSEDDLDDFDDLDDMIEELDDEFGDELDEEELLDEESLEDTELTLTDIGYKYIEELEEGTDSWLLFDYSRENEGLITYDENGYARIHPEVLPEGAYSKDIDIIGTVDRYVVSCNSSVGEVGDVLRFTQKDGNIVECVVGYNDNSKDNENFIRFFVDPEKVENNGTEQVFTGETEIIRNLITNNESYNHVQKTPFTKIENKSTIIE